MKLVKSPDPWLEKVVKEFDFDALDAKSIAQEMINLMTAEGGIGLSANQVALDAQILVMKPHLLENKEPFAMINPVIESVTINMENMPEGCLSFPKVYVKVTRPKEILVKYYDENLKEVSTKVIGYSAKCFLLYLSKKHNPYYLHFPNELLNLELLSSFLPYHLVF